MMKPTLLAAAALAAFSLPAFADGHRGGRGPDPMKMFEEIDANSDGAVTREEMTAWREARFKAADANGDGALEPQEMAAAMTARMQADIAQRARVMVARGDENGDGKLSMEEAANGREARMFDRLDRNDDGKVDKSELKRMKRDRDHHGERGHDRRHD